MEIDYLRLSLTDHCNLDCFYCNPLDKEKFLKHEDILSIEEQERIIRLMVPFGIKKIRLTGGEPLLKKGLVEAVKRFKAIDGIEEVSITTNGTTLKENALHLKEAGLDRVNISLDTLKKDRFIDITGKDNFEQVWQGIEEALKVGLIPVKLNVILLGGINDDELVDFANLTLKYPLHVRFIELFQTSRRLESNQVSTLRSADAKQIIEASLGSLKQVDGVVGNGPAEYDALEGAQGTIGFISNLSEHFCDTCNRLRMDSVGRIAPCLFSGYLYDLKSLIRSEADDKMIMQFLEEIFNNKGKYNKLCDHLSDSIEMSSVGG